MHWDFWPKVRQGAVGFAVVANNALEVASLPRFAKNKLTETEVIGRFDEGFANLGLQGKINAGFEHISNTFGSSYADAIRNRFGQVGVDPIKGGDILGMFEATKKGGVISLNTHIGNPEVFANVMLHEIRHLRQFEKMGSSISQWNKLPDEVVERFATSTNIWQGKRLGVSEEDMQMFVKYYNEWR